MVMPCERLCALRTRMKRTNNRNGNSSNHSSSRNGKLNNNLSSNNISGSLSRKGTTMATLVCLRARQAACIRQCQLRAVLPTH